MAETPKVKSCYTCRSRYFRHPADSHSYLCLSKHNELDYISPVTGRPAMKFLSSEACRATELGCGPTGNWHELMPSEFPSLPTAQQASLYRKKIGVTLEDL